jgi:hypothetical protein
MIITSHIALDVGNTLTIPSTIGMSHNGITTVHESRWGMGVIPYRR